MWETLKPFPLFFGGAQNQPQTRYVYSFNGVDSYITTTIITLSSESSLSFKFVAPTSYLPRNEIFIGGDTVSGFFCFADASGNYQDSFVENVNRFIDGVPLNDGDPLPTDGKVHQITFGAGAFRNGNTIRSIGAQIDPAPSNYASFPIFDVVVDDGSAYNYPINDSTFGSGAPIANSATVLGSNLWGGQNLTVANVGVVTTVVSGEEWDVYSLNGSPSNVVHGARVNVFSGLADGEQYLYDIDSSEPVNIAVYDAGYQLVSGGVVENGKGILFTHNGTSRMYVCPRTTNTIRVSNGRVRLANGYATGVNLLESGWQEINI